MGNIADILDLRIWWVCPLGVSSSDLYLTQGYEMRIAIFYIIFISCLPFRFCTKHQQTMMMLMTIFGKKKVKIFKGLVNFDLCND